MLFSRAYFRCRDNEFKAGKLKHYFHKCKELTGDKETLQKVLGLKLKFFGDPPAKYSFYIPLKLEVHFINLEILKLLAKGIITKCEQETGEYISPILTRQKSDGSCRLILNLKKLNEDMPYIQFKIETLHSVLLLFTPGSYLASLDLKDAYYSVPYTQFTLSF